MANEKACVVCGKLEDKVVMVRFFNFETISKDNLCLRLCRIHHVELFQLGETRFLSKYQHCSLNVKKKERYFLIGEYIRWRP